MSIRHRNGRPIVEVYNPAVGRKVHVKPADFGMDLRGLTGRALDRAARELEDKALAFYAGGVRVETCDGFARRWPAAYPEGRGESTREVNRERLTKFIEDFAGRPLHSLTRSEARAWAQANAYRLPAVRAMYEDALRDGIVKVNPFAALGVKTSKSRRDVTVLTREEVHALADMATRVHGEDRGADARAMILWAAYTCCRPGESYAARYSRLHGDLYDVDLQWNGKLHQESPPKYGSDGMIFVPQEAREAVLDKPRRLGDDLMFRSVEGGRFTPSAWHYVWSPVRAAFIAGLPLTHHLQRRPEPLAFHELRHFGASYMLNVLGIEPWVIAEQLRHKDGGTLVTTLYGHPDRDVALERIRGAFQGSGENAPTKLRDSGDSRGTAGG